MNPASPVSRIAHPMPNFAMSGWVVAATYAEFPASQQP